LKILERAKEAIGIFPIEYKSFLFIYLCKENMVLAQGLSDHVVRNGWKFAKWHKSSHVRDGSPGAVERKKVNKREKWVIWSGGGARGDERADGRTEARWVGAKNDAARSPAPAPADYLLLRDNFAL